MGEIDWQCDDGICEHTDRVAGKCACYNKERVRRDETPEMLQEQINKLEKIFRGKI